MKEMNDTEATNTTSFESHIQTVAHLFQPHSILSVIATHMFNLSTKLHLDESEGS